MNSHKLAEFETSGGNSESNDPYEVKNDDEWLSQSPQPARMDTKHQEKSSYLWPQSKTQSVSN